MGPTVAETNAETRGDAEAGGDDDDGSWMDVHHLKGTLRQCSLGLGQHTVTWGVVWGQDQLVAGPEHITDTGGHLARGPPRCNGAALARSSQRAHALELGIACGTSCSGSDLHGSRSSDARDVS